MYVFGVGMKQAISYAINSFDFPFSSNMFDPLNGIERDVGKLFLPILYSCFSFYLNVYFEISGFWFNFAVEFIAHLKGELLGRI